MADGRNRGGRAPTAGERDLWRTAMRDVQPLHREEDPARLAAPDVAAKDRADDPGAGSPAGDGAPNPPSRKWGRKQAADAASTPAPEPVRVDSLAGIDRRTAERLRRGRLPIEASIDLHGLTRRAAEDALARFLTRAAERGQRCVLVITGKGRATGEPVLRSEVPRWLNQPALRQRVLACVTARQRDGGAGAFYVLLRRRRA